MHHFSSKIMKQSSLVQIFPLKSLVKWLSQSSIQNVLSSCQAKTLTSFIYYSVSDYKYFVSSQTQYSLLTASLQNYVCNKLSIIVVTTHPVNIQYSFCMVSGLEKEKLL
jgi:hypothetical protein